MNDINLVRFEAFTAVAMKKAVFWDIHGAKSQKTAFFKFFVIVFVAAKLNLPRLYGVVHF